MLFYIYLQAHYNNLYTIFAIRVLQIQTKRMVPHPLPHYCQYVKVQHLVTGEKVLWSDGFPWWSPKPDTVLRQVADLREPTQKLPS